MSRLLEEQTSAEHMLREWLPDDREEVERDVDALLARGLEIVYADTHSDGAGITFLALPPAPGRPALLRRPGLHALVWVSIHHGGHHIRTIALHHLVGVSLDDEREETRLTLHVAAPISTTALAARSEPQRSWLRGMAEDLQVLLLKPISPK